MKLLIVVAVLRCFGSIFVDGQVQTYLKGSNIGKIWQQNDNNNDSVAILSAAILWLTAAGDFTSIRATILGGGGQTNKNVYLAATTTSFGYTGNIVYFIVPTGVTSLSITLTGASGGGTYGGFGAVVTTTFLVSPGDLYSICVGGQGSGGWTRAWDCVGGGGAGGYVTMGGGGASSLSWGDVTQGAVYLAIAGAGGGDSCSLGCQNGGNAGCLLLSAFSGGGYGPGGGGSYSAGGSGGSYYYSTDSHQATGQKGGHFNHTGGNADPYGGGGGSGYYGGGGGAYGSGGGGCSYCEYNTGSTTCGVATSRSSGSVVITYTVITSPPTPTPTSKPLSTTSPASVPSLSQTTYAPSATSAPSATLATYAPSATLATYAPSANSLTTVQATQTVAGVTSDSASFRTAFAAAAASVLPTGSTVTIVSVTVVDVRHRQLLTAAVSVVYTVSSTAAANTLSSSLSSGTAAMSTALQTSYPTAVVATPVVITIVSPVASPIASPVSAPSGPSLVPIIAGAVGGGGGGLLLILGLGYLFYRRNALRKLTESQIHAAASPDAAGRNDNDNNRVSGSKELQAPKTGIASPTTNLSGIKLPPISSELKSSAKVAIVDTTEVPAGNSSSKVGLSSSISGKEEGPKHIMMSYCWAKTANPKHVEALAVYLRSKYGYDVWQDIEGSSICGKMSGGTDEKMAEAVNKSAYVIICVSKAYPVSANCAQEAKYAKQREKAKKLQIIYVMMQEEYTTVSKPEFVDDWLAMYMADKLWYPLWDIKQLAETGKVNNDLYCEIPDLISPVHLLLVLTHPYYTVCDFLPIVRRFHCRFNR